MPKTPLTLAAIGCGSRAQIYASLAARRPDLFRVVAAADPNPARVERLRALSGNAAFRGFPNDTALLSAGRLADVMIIATQDNFHVAPCLAALRAGYDVLLEKPVATRFRDVLEVNAAAVALGRRVLICHVLRYTPFYTTIKRLLATGVLGEVATIDAIEGVEMFHMAHSFVRGHWAVTAESSPMIIAKSCHDMDIISWLADAPCEAVSSFGSLSYFNAQHAPAGAPARCTDGCPVAADCLYDAHRYLGPQRPWLQWICDRHDTATDSELTAWLAHSPWSRCVYRCDNTAVDRQTVNLTFANRIVATFTMTAFSRGREISIRGTRGVLYAGDAVRRHTGADIIVEHHLTGTTERINIEEPTGGYSGHFGGDAGLIDALPGEWRQPDPASMRSSLQRSVESHAMGFAAEESRLTGKTVMLDEFRARHQSSEAEASPLPGR
ncbi:Gfo/Idh/MocA family oxidoreductase [Horticoccus luteus]|uniref:Gfo/Idh/MocA family oxidoreductase n=1 Tax=Horticoccus luteus TaxID=2862869 RepID=A0A8F9XK67_9BACT|nr:Gfo/Idh/MocA family oxidoreductase [Horticoccus luteus]QYM77891.1 Gfo/Idh/MocA family oxidoreductase [Horticoccus luteus]